MIKLITQIIITLAVAILGLALMGPVFYFTVGTVLAFVCFGCLLAVPGKYDADAEDSVLGFAARDLGVAALVGLGFGTVWPALPLIVAWGFATRRSVYEPPFRPVPYSARRRDEAP